MLLLKRRGWECGSEYVRAGIGSDDESKSVTTVGFPKIKEGVARIDDGESEVLLSETTGQIHLLNETAARIASLCDGAHDENAIVDVILDDYATDLSRDVVLEQVMQIIDKLTKADVIESSASPVSDGGVHDDCCEA